MNNEERLEIAKEYLNNIRPLKDIYTVYKANTNSKNVPKTMESITVYHNTITNERLFNQKPCEDNSYIIKALGGTKVAELRYIEKINTFAFCVYTIKLVKKGYDVQSMLSKFSGAYLIFPDKTVECYYVDKDFQKKIESKTKRSRNKFDFRPWLFNDILNNDKKSWAETIQRIFPVAFIRGNIYEIIDDRFKLYAWLINKEPLKRNGKMQKIIDDLLKIQLQDVDEKKFEFSDYDVLKCDDEGRNINVVISPVKDNMVCLRWFRLNNYSKTFFETSRLYVDKENQYFCRKNSFGEFIAQTGKMNSNNFVAQKVIFDKEDVFDWTRLEYYKNVLPEIPSEKVSSVLWAFLYHPLTEIFWKQGMEYCVMWFLCTCGGASDSFENFLSSYFGDIDASKKSVTKILGINNFQISILNELEKTKKYSSEIALRKAKKALETPNISNFTDEQSRKLLYFMTKKYRLESSIEVEIFKLLKNAYSLDIAFSMLDKLNTIKYEVVEDSYQYCFMRTEAENAIVAYRDYLSMVSQMNAGEYFRPDFETIDDIRNMHKEIIEIFNARKSIINAENFNKRINDWKKFEYIGKDFAVVIPTTPDDLANEGFVLHHCVKSYIDRISDGNTNVVFIRKRNELDKPFFTVEIDNNNTIQQVHGFANKNANEEEGMTQFVKEWAKERKLNVSDFNKVR